ncbi:TetR/AcrR family transcriptional regulator [Novosphingobium sp.]|uniref:TetR/AcrR family transcriptional regulator n=1 Tax=Novosphingobium sp. TaxID=1874826 RepID=UPI002617C6CB|nr:TetR/AcrR family transcriptional regulator [Novosphingobium sp.]
MNLQSDPVISMDQDDPAVDTAIPRGRRPSRSAGASPRQIAKSEAMRLRVLEATVDCLQEGKSHEVSIAVIAERAQISRGAVQYHFATRRELLCAVIAHINARRLQQFRADLAEIGPGEDLAERIVDTHWKHLGERDFLAYQELVLLARSDPDLTEGFAPLYQDFLGEWYETARRAFGWSYRDREVMKAGNIAHYLLEGMAYGQLAGQLSSEVVADMLDHTKSILRAAIQKKQEGG